MVREEVKKWMDKAEDDLEKAKVLFKNKKYDGTLFYCQQAAEKGLKALLINKKNRIRKIHDLVELGKEVNLPKNLLEYCKELTMAYIYSGYPDIEEERNLKAISSNFLIR